MTKTLVRYRYVGIEKVSVKVVNGAVEKAQAVAELEKVNVPTSNIIIVSVDSVEIPTEQKEVVVTVEPITAEAVGVKTIKKMTYLEIRDIVKNMGDVCKVELNIDNSSDDFALYVNVSTYNDDFEDLEVMNSTDIAECETYGEELYKKFARLFKSNRKMKLVKAL